MRSPPNAPQAKSPGEPLTVGADVRTLGLCRGLQVRTLQLASMLFQTQQDAFGHHLAIICGFWDMAIMLVIILTGIQGMRVLLFFWGDYVQHV